MLDYIIQLRNIPTQWFLDLCHQAPSLHLAHYIFEKRSSLDRKHQPSQPEIKTIYFFLIAVHYNIQFLKNRYSCNVKQILMWFFFFSLSFTRNNCCSQVKFNSCKFYPFKTWLQLLEQYFIRNLKQVTVAEQYLIFPSSNLPSQWQFQQRTQNKQKNLFHRC